MGGNAMGFDLFSVMFSIIFFLILGLFVTIFVRNISQWHKNNHSPRLTVPVSVVTKRTSVIRQGSPVHTSTTYYVTFQVESGDRMELNVPGREFGMIAQGDSGNLTFQGTRFLNFDRT